LRSSTCCTVHSRQLLGRGPPPPAACGVPSLAVIIEARFRNLQRHRRLNNNVHRCSTDLNI
jgi:hypothetical protein